MTIDQFNLLLYIWIALALLLFPIQLFITAPYGRHTHHRWGLQISNQFGWVIMEIVSPLVLAYFFLSGSHTKTTPMWIFFGLWMLHYLHRSIIYPLRTRTRHKKIPLLIVLSAILFNSVNAFTNGYYLGDLGPVYSTEWLYDFRFLAGMTLFLIGAATNIHSDEILLRLRKPGETGYKIPQGGLFHYLSCPNHFGEILEWAGFALLCWNLPALGFAIWTAANLIPRAISHHRWYQQHFPDYPKERKAVIPFLI